MILVPEAGRGWRPTRPGPQGPNTIAATAAEQLRRATHGPRPTPRGRPPAARRLDAVESRLCDVERLLGLVMLRQRGGA